MLKKWSIVVVTNICSVKMHDDGYLQMYLYNIYACICIHSNPTYTKLIVLKTFTNPVDWYGTIVSVSFKLNFVILFCII